MLARLQAKFTVSETHFYRIPPQIDALKSTVLPELIATNRQQRQLRFWSAGCSSGEEAYTLLMLLEEIGGLKGWDVRVLGTDLNPEVIELARSGVYGHWSFRDTPFAAIDRFFHVSNGKYRVHKNLRDRSDFQISNLVAPQDKPDQKFDLILCRNVTIYFAPETAQRVYQKLEAQLVPGGWLILGPSDPPIQAATLKQMNLELMLLPGVVFWKKPRQPGTQTLVTPRPEPKPTPLELWQRHLQDGDNSLQSGDYGTALEQLRRVVFLEPNQPVGQIRLAQALLGLGQHARAFAALRQARRLLLMLEPESTAWGCSMTCTELIQCVEGLLEQIKHPEVNR